MGDFMLDTSVLAGETPAFDEVPLSERTRTVALQWTQSGAGEDMEIFGYAVRYFPVETQTMTANVGLFAGGDVAYLESVLGDVTRNIQLEYTQSGAGEDMEILGYMIRYTPGETHALD